MLERSVTPKLSGSIVKLLVQKRRWSITRIARTVKAPSDFVRRVQAGRQSFLPHDVEAIARACKEPAHLLIFKAMNPEDMPADRRGLYFATLELLESTGALRLAVRRKSTKKRRTRNKAA
jgi:hypothetical protein